MSETDITGPRENLLIVVLRPDRVLRSAASRAVNVTIQLDKFRRVRHIVLTQLRGGSP